MSIYHVYKSEVTGYDTYSDFVVVANTEEEAKNTYPGNYSNKALTLEEADDEYTWPIDSKYVTTELIGVANDTYKEITIICSSFHAG